MEFSNLKNILCKENAKKALDFVKRHVRYFSAGALFVVLVLILVFGTQPRKPDGVIDPTETDTQVVEEYQIDAHEDVNLLITQYYTAYASGDVAALAAIATPMTENEQSYISMFSQYVEEYRNIKCYTKSGIEEGSYLVSVAMELKFKDIETTAPGLDFFYVRTGAEGKLYIDNLYSTYNRLYKENASDAGVQLRMTEFEGEEDVIALQTEIQQKYEATLLADENLSNMVRVTIPGAVNNWRAALIAQDTQAPEETPTETTEQPETPPKTPETPPETPQEPETPPEQPAAQSETMQTTDKVNLRSAASTSSDKLATVGKGETVTRTGTEGDWSIVEYNGTTGYIKSEFLTAVSSDNTNTSEPVDAYAEGTVIVLQNTVNVRSSMSETADKVGTAYAGEKVTVVMSYAEGWTKVNWNNKTGYIKTSVLQ